MLELNTQQELCRRFSILLGYPDDQVEALTMSCLARMREINCESATHLESFHTFLKTNELARIEEAFTGTFDLQAQCHPYVGYQLCGESQQRTMFMIKLRELHQQFDFVPGNELPDHLTEMMRFIGSISDSDCRNEIIKDGLLPALDKLTQGIEDNRNPYISLLFALQSFLSKSVDVEGERLSTERQEECLS